MSPVAISLDSLIAHVRSLHPDGGPLDHLSGAVVTARELSDQADALIGHFVDQARGIGGFMEPDRLGHGRDQAGRAKAVHRPR